MTMTEDRVPAFIEVSSGEFGAHPGRMLAEVAAGAVVRIVDRRMGIIRAYLTAEAPVGLEPVRDLLAPPALPDGSPPPAPGEKHCPACKQNKPATAKAFHRAARSPDGLNWQCKLCQNRANETSYSRRRAAGSETTR